MELRHLRYFVAVAEELHFARAAARLGIEQSPLSRQIRDFERELGVRLFHRTSRSTWLSTPGEQFLTAARRILLDLDSSIADVRAHAESAVRIRVGFAEGLAGMPFGDLLRAAAAGERNLRIQPVERPLADMVRMLSLGAIDAILAPEQAFTADTVSTPAWEEPLAVLLPTSSGSDGIPIRLSAIELPIILPDPEQLLGLSRQMEALLSVRQRSRASQSRFLTLPMLYALVASGHGAGLLPASLAVASDWNVMRPVRDRRARIALWLTQRHGDDAETASHVVALMDAVRAQAKPD